MSATAAPLSGGMAQSTDRTPRPGDVAAMQSGVDDAFGKPTDLGAIFAGGKPQLRLAGIDGQNEAPGQAPAANQGPHHGPEQDSEAGHVAGMILTTMLPGAAAIGAKVMHAQEFYEKEMKSDGAHSHMGRKADGTLTVNNDEVIDMGRTARDNALKAKMSGPRGMRR